MSNTTNRHGDMLFTLRTEIEDSRQGTRRNGFILRMYDRTEHQHRGTFHQHLPVPTIQQDNYDPYVDIRRIVRR